MSARATDATASLAGWDTIGRAATDRPVALLLSYRSDEAAQVYAATDAYLAGVSDTELAQVVETPVGAMPLGSFIGLWVLNAHCHAGEISALKGLKGLQGYPA